MWLYASMKHFERFALIFEKLWAALVALSLDFSKSTLLSFKRCVEAENASVACYIERK